MFDKSIRSTKRSFGFLIISIYELNIAGKVVKY